MASPTQKGLKISWIELCRFLAAFCIVWYHFGYAPILKPSGEWACFRSGYLFVEYFFMLTGYFSVAHIEKSKCDIKTNLDSFIGRYVLNKYVSLLPYMALSVLVSYFLIFLGAYPKKEILNFPLEFFGLYDGFIPNPINIHLWYIGAMAITLPIVLYLNIKMELQKFFYFSLVVPILLYGYILNARGTLDVLAFQWGILRAFAGMFLGCFIYYLSNIISHFQFTKVGKLFLSIIEVATFILAILYVSFQRLHNTQHDLFFVFIIIISLLCTFSRQSFSSYFTSSFLYFLGRLSMPIYFFHYPIIHWVKFFFPGMSIWLQMLLISVSTVIISCCSLWIVKNLLPIMKSKLYRLFIISE